MNRPGTAFGVVRPFFTRVFWSLLAKLKIVSSSLAASNQALSIKEMPSGPSNGRGDSNC